MPPIDKPAAIQRPGTDESEVDRGLRAEADRLIGHRIQACANAIREKNLDGVLVDHADDIVVSDVPALGNRALSTHTENLGGVFPWFDEAGVFDVQKLEITAGDDVAFWHDLIRCSRTEPGEPHATAPRAD